MSGRHALSLHKKDLSSFTLLIGGLAVHVENSICADLIDGEPAEYSSFLCPSSEVTGGAQMSMEMKLVS